ARRGLRSPVQIVLSACRTRCQTVVGVVQLASGRLRRTCPSEQPAG
ncbi:uncharacterized protein METZ01_LOCUS89164, partial [marine metagenome]